MKQVKEKKQLPEKVEQPGRSARAVLKFVRISPRKVRLVINAIRYQHPDKAFGILFTLQKKAARITEKVLKTAVANAKVLNLDAERLYISDIRADGGPSMKRFIERSMGRGDKILKRTTHLSIVLSEGVKKWKTTSAPQIKEEEKETPKSGKKLFGKKKAAAGAK